MSQQRRHPAQAGYTLIELVVVVALLLVVLVPILMALQGSTSRSNDLRNNTDARAQARAAIDLFVRDFRQAQTLGDTAITPVVAFSSSSITFYSPDKTQPPLLRRITYTIAGNRLLRQIDTSSTTGAPWAFTAGQPNVAIDNVATGSSFAVFERDGSATTDPTIVRRLDMSLTVNGIPRPGASQNFVQSVEIRTEY